MSIIILKGKEPRTPKRADPPLFAKACVELQCTCGQLILKSYADGTTKLRSKIVLFNDCGEGVAVCRSCGCEYPVPIRLQKTIKSDLKVRHYVLDKKV
ncbi:MAG: hypothetical protein V1897_03145 [Pseudomonadota bacterium]